MMNNRIMKITVIFLSFSVLFSSCGVMFGGSKYRGSIIVNEHSDAEIYSNGEKLGVGKVEKLFPRNQTLNIELRKDGCDNYVKNFSNTFRTGNFILSLFSWGLIGAMIDLGTGASFKPDHNHYPEVVKMTDKRYVFNLNYEGCPADTIK